MEEWSVSGSAEHPTACRKQAVTPGIIDVILTQPYKICKINTLKIYKSVFLVQIDKHFSDCPLFPV